MRSRLLVSVLTLFAILVPSVVLAQSATLLPNGRQQFLDANGDPLASGQVFMYAPPATTTPKTTWQDAGRATPNSNPVTLDSAGTALIYGVGGYRQLVKDALGNTIWDAQTAATGATSGAQYAGTSTGTTNAQVVSATSFTGANGEQVAFTAGFTNSGAMTLNVGAGVWPVVFDGPAGPSALVGGEVVTGNYVVVAWDSVGTKFNLVTAPASIVTAAGAQTLSNKTFLAVDGSAGAPGFAWTSDTDTGLYRIGANNIGVTANGAKVVDIATTGLTTTGTLNATTTAAGTISTLTSTAAGPSVGPVLVLDRNNSASPSNVIGQQSFNGRTSTSATNTYARITASISDPANANPLGKLELVATGTANTAAIALTAASQPTVAVQGILDINNSTLSGQIKFPATQNPSSNANTLDAYAEGTWTPTLAFGGGSTGITYAVRTGTYTLVGNLMCFSGEIFLSNKGSSTGTATFTALPLGATSSGTSPAFAISTAGGFSGLTGALSASISGGTTISFSQSSSTGTATISDTVFTNSTSFRIGGCFFV